MGVTIKIVYLPRFTLDLPFYGLLYTRMWTIECDNSVVLAHVQAFRITIPLGSCHHLPTTCKFYMYAHLRFILPAQDKSVSLKVKVY